MLRFVGGWADRSALPAGSADGSPDRGAPLAETLADAAAAGSLSSRTSMDQLPEPSSLLEDAQASTSALPSVWNQPVFEAPQEWCSNAITFAAFAIDYMLLQRPLSGGAGAASGGATPAQTQAQATATRISPGLSYSALWAAAGGDQKTGAKALPPPAELAKRKVALLKVAGSRALPDAFGVAAAVAALGDGTDSVRQEARSVLERCIGSAPLEHVDFEAGAPDKATTRLAAVGLPSAERQRQAPPGEGYLSFCDELTAAGSGGGATADESPVEFTDPRLTMRRVRVVAFLLRNLFSIVLGGATKSTPQHMRRLPGPETSRIEALRILSRSRTAAHVMPDATLVMTQCFLSKKASLRVRRAAAPFVSSFLRRTPEAVLKRLAPILLAGLVNAIRSLQDDSTGKGASPATGQFAHTASSVAAGDAHGRESIRQGIDRNEREKVREACYSQLVLLAGRAPAAVSSTGSTAAFLVEMAQREPSHMRLSVSAALSRCMLAYAGAIQNSPQGTSASDKLLSSLRKTVELAARSADARLRLVAAQWCGSVLEATDEQAKMLCVELAGDPAREVRVEAYRGLVPGARVSYLGSLTRSAAADGDSETMNGSDSGSPSVGKG